MRTFDIYDAFGFSHEFESGFVLICRWIFDCLD